VDDEHRQPHDPRDDDPWGRRVHWVPLTGAVAIAVVGIGGLALFDAV